MDAIHDTGAVGVHAEVTSPSARHRAYAGTAAVNTTRPMPQDGRFRIGSATKTFTATVVLQLVGEGRMSLEDTVERWLPGVVRGNGNDGGRVTVRELGRLAMRHPPEFSPPGAGWSYSNTNYVLAAMIVHKVTGRNWARETRDRIIRPLGLRHTSTPGVSASVPLPHAQSYAAFGTDTGTDVTELDAMTTAVAVPELGVKYGHGTRTATVYVASDPGRHTQRAMTTLVGRELCRAAVGPPTPPWRG